MALRISAPSQTETHQVYWIGQLEPNVERVVYNEHAFQISNLHARLRAPRCPFHCTIKFDQTPSKEREEKWNKEMSKWGRIPLDIHALVVAKEGVAAEVKFVEGWDLGLIFNMPETMPHITLRVARGHRAREMGPVMLEAKCIKWKDTGNDRLQTAVSREGEPVFRIKLDNPVTVWGVPQVVEIMDIEPQEKEEIPYAKGCPYGNQFCLYRLFPGAGRRCWDKTRHVPFSKEDAEWSTYMRHLSWCPKKRAQGGQMASEEVHDIPYVKGCPYGNP
ncbi:uncharacterized protein LOC121677924 [Alosa sapidissima]|uniref:uncharacterized protein LOC121677924 n=1 Tax=Alosa sapidissima TaxID=34773 RepID=UPI001C081A5F|nr:uncharacterized protein LOC121677924 [Alosa sapidissima]